MSSRLQPKTAEHTSMDDAAVSIKMRLTGSLYAYPMQRQEPANHPDRWQQLSDQPTILKTLEMWNSQNHPQHHPGLSFVDTRPSGQYSVSARARYKFSTLRHLLWYSQSQTVCLHADNGLPDIL